MTMPPPPPPDVAVEVLLLDDPQAARPIAAIPVAANTLTDVFPSIFLPLRGTSCPLSE
jgi:hypothetical protein